MARRLEARIGLAGSGGGTSVWSTSIILKSTLTMDMAGFGYGGLEAVGNFEKEMTRRRIRD